MLSQKKISKKDDLYNGVTLPAPQANYIWSLAWLSFCSGVYAMRRGYYDLSLVPLGVWLTSMNYWRRPDFSWRRYLDIMYVHSSLAYQLTRAVKAQNARSYFICISIAIFFFPIGIYYKQKPSTSAFFHGMVHIFGNIANVILYSGEVPTPKWLCNILIKKDCFI